MKKTTKELIIENIKKYMKSRDLTLQKAADELSVNVSTLKRWLSGESTIGKESINLIIEKWDFDPTEVEIENIINIEITESNFNVLKQTLTDNMLSYKLDYMVEKINDIYNTLLSIYEKLLSIKNTIKRFTHSYEFKGFIILFLITIVFIELNKYINITYSLLELLIVLYGIFVIICPVIRFFGVKEK